MNEFIVKHLVYKNGNQGPKKETVNGNLQNSL